LRKAPKKHPVRNVFALFTLAIVCVCGVELAVARFEDPALYDSIVAPARESWQEAHAQISDYIEQQRAERERRRLEELARQEELSRRREAQRQRELAATELAIQMASKPVIQEELIVADPAITEFVFDGDVELLTGGAFDLVYYNQSDEVWANEPFGADPIDRYGCGPTALAMVVASLADPDATPASVAAWAARAGYCAPRSGSYLSIVQGTAKNYGLECVSLGATDIVTLQRYLSGGGIVVALMGPGHFTGRGHFILLHGVTPDGGILVADPNSRENSLAVWDAQLILDELSQSRHDGAPLWLITTTPAI
jgi:hypothetical protein